MRRLGLFTTLRARAGSLWFWEDHLARLEEGARLYSLQMPDPSVLFARVARATRDLGDARVRITLRPDEGPEVEARAYEAPGEPWRLAPVPASPVEDIVRHKTTERKVYDQAAAQKGQADEALLVAHSGAYLECTVANLFFWDRAGRLVTPPATAPLLPGIARKHVLAAAQNLGLEAIEGDVSEDLARSARACFLTNALFVLHPVSEICGVKRYAVPELVRRLRDVAGPR
ncbi:MAG: aminotransferase class IV [Planctomycetota bacterium]|jgi:branched-subunit amino acid aminotransferase/4-amino-4-deoxychorismate lyase